jgi:8-oxo-dGTP pyrophosphatase MutT (NUDIX family)
MAEALNAGWLRKLHASVNAPPLQPRVPLWAGESIIGSVEPDFLSQKSLQPLFSGREQLLKKEQPSTLGWRLLGDVSTSLDQLAKALNSANLGGVWRGEQLAVHDQFGHLKGSVERAAVRSLGIATQAVHLAARTPDGRHWVQQRALNKANDPGLWDTLMGGMVSSAETVLSALARETWEEAGLTPDQLQNLVRGGVLNIRKPSIDGNGAGYVVENIDWYHCTVGNGIVPVNQDGEVAQFKLLTANELMLAMQRGEFTTEAALILAEVLDIL